MAMVRILGISGSLRKGSFNSAALRVARESAPAGVEVMEFDLSPIPLFNEDVEKQGFPEPVRRLHQAIADADAILIATPEYNYSVPGVLKNAIDWASRPPGKSTLTGKPMAIFGASPGMFGSGRAQYHLRQSMVFLDVKLVNRPEVMIAQAHTKFDDQGNCTDEKTRQKIGELVASLADWTRKLGK